MCKNFIMIQRQQTLWLILAAVASFLSFKFSFYSGNIIENGTGRYEELEAGSTLFLLILTGACGLIAAISIFLFKDRQTQLRLCLAGIILSIILLVLYFVEVKKFEKGTFSLTCIFGILIPIAFFFAARGIRRDQKLVKSLDKLR